MQAEQNIVQAPVKVEKDRKVKEAKGWKHKLKRHKDAILAIHSIDGIDSRFLMSGSADHTVRRKSFLINITYFLLQFGIYRV